jgi:phage terminase large subunit
MKLRHIEASLFELLPDEIKESMLLSGVIPVVDPFLKLYDLPKGTNMVICIGGRGGAKSHEVSRFAVHDVTNNNRRVAILRDEKETIRESILNEIFMRYDDSFSYNHFSTEFIKSNLGIKNKETGNMVLFTKGFRASSGVKKTNLKGVSDTDTAIIEEAEDIRDFTKFNTFMDSIRTKNRLIIVMLNTPDIHHWIVKRYFNLELVEDGYWKLIPKNIPGLFVIQTSYKDNPYLPIDLVKDYEGSGNPNHHRYDPHYYKTDILGYASSGRKGQILTKVKSISLADYMALPYREHYAQDFGTASPAGMVGYKIHKNTSWARQMNYLPMTVLEIGMHYDRLKLNIADEVVCDGAEPKSIRKLKQGWNADELSVEEFTKYPSLAVGFNVVPCIKGPDSINYGLDVMKSMELFVVEESIEFHSEIQNYVYDIDKNGNSTDNPKDDNNHLIDPWRYGINRHRGKGKAGSTAA